MPYKGDLDKMKRIGLIFVGILVSLTTSVYAAQCGGKGYEGVSSTFCLKCHKNGCSILHPARGIKVVEKRCLKIPANFPLSNGYLTCVTCHDMDSNNKFFLRTQKGKPFKNELDFCFECHIKSCYRKFNPHTSMLNSSGGYNAKVCIYCHGMGWNRKAYEMCVGCHTKAPHVGAYEHIIASTDSLKPYIKDGKVLNVKELNINTEKKEFLKWYKEGKPILINGKITCITCHNPHPMTAVKSKSVSIDWKKMEDEDFRYKLRKLYGRLEYYSINRNGVKLMVKPANKGKLCITCHSINSLK